jgi:Domain of unknown function (DUF3883)
MLTVEEMKEWKWNAIYHFGVNEVYEVLQNPADPKMGVVIWYEINQKRGNDGYFHPDESTIKIVYQTNAKGSLRAAENWAIDACIASPEWRFGLNEWFLDDDDDDDWPFWVGKPHPYGSRLKAVKKGAKADDGLTDELSPSAQGYMQQAAQRRAVELRAVKAASAHYRKLGYKVENTSDTHPYDLRCRKRKQEVRVEVKGSIGDGAEVFLTAGEIEHARGSGVRTDLFVWGNVKIVGDGNEVRGIEGRLVFHFERWKPSDDDLTPTQYRYRLPC